MFDKTEIIEFFNRIINAPELKEQEIKQNVSKFYEYLELTQMCDEASLNKLSKIIICLNEILAIKKTVGYIDINTLLLAPEEQKRLVKRPRNQKHYNHYESGNNSSCGSTSYSSSCGASSPRYTSRC